MWTADYFPRITSFAPQFLVDNLERSIAFYVILGFVFDEPRQAAHAVGYLDMNELHLKEAPRNPSERQHRRANDHCDASAGVEGIELFFNHCLANDVTIIKPLAQTPSGTLDFYVEDPDGYIICFSGLKPIPGPDRERLLHSLRRDIEATLGAGRDHIVIEAIDRIARYNDDVMQFRARVVDDVQQHFHDMFIDTVWPACPYHPNHPLWLHGEQWVCEQSGVAVAKLGELGR